MRTQSLQYLQKKWQNATLGAALAFWGGVVHAQTLPDPTRPPPGFVDPADLKAGGVPGQGTTASAAAPGATIDSPGMVLQSVLLPKQGKPVAVISGKYLPLGAKMDDWVLSKVSERDVVLLKGKERRVLQLTPQVSKTMVPSTGEPDKRLAVPKKTKVAKRAKKVQPKKAS